MKLQFASLNPQDALWVAVGIEERNAGIYENFARTFREYDPQTADIFDEMAAEERLHKKVLEERYHQRFGPEPGRFTPQDIAQLIEAPALQKSDLFMLEGLSTQEAVQVGLRAEREARDFYGQLAQRTADEALRLLYYEMAAIEGDHEVRLGNRVRAFAEGFGSRVEEAPAR